ncbi:putative transport system integral membrane protein [Paenibacillus sp. JCM 10914]|nr:putative transport system integral membrane protein [Paenibacillus sp. JCM 10914]
MIKRSKSEVVFEMFNYIFLAVISGAMIFPILHVAAQSLSSDLAISRGDVGLWPVEFTWSNYAVVLNDTSVWRSFMISVLVTVLGTAINLIATASLAYPLSRTEYNGRKAILMLVLITFIFSAPLIPNYLLIKSLSMLDTVWALMIPGAISAYNLFIMRSFFMNLPNEIIDSAGSTGAESCGLSQASCCRYRNRSWPRWDCSTRLRIGIPTRPLYTISMTESCFRFRFGCVRS